MLKKTAFLSLLFSLSFSQAFAVFEENEKEGTMKWTSPTLKGELTFKSASESDYYAYSTTLKSLPIKDGYPALDEKTVDRFTSQNLDRQKEGNPYHLYALSFKGKENDNVLGFVQFGRMPTLNYEEGITEKGTEHYPIIQKWMYLGITQHKDPKEGLKKDNIERIENRGIAIFLPMFSKTVQENTALGEVRDEAIEACYEMICWRAQQGKLLPVEKTIPHIVMGLFHPNDNNMMKSFLANGFQQDNNPGFGWFYPKSEMVFQANESKFEKPVTRQIPQPRIMMTKKVKQNEKMEKKD